jgi:hypothetical protein
MTGRFQLSIDPTSRSVTLRAIQLSLESPWETVRQVVGRLLASPPVESIEIDRRTATAILKLKDCGETPAKPDASVREIAASLRTPVTSCYIPGDVYSRSSQLIFSKTGAGFTAASVLSQIPGRIRLRHPLLQRNADLARRVEVYLAANPDVVDVSASSLTGSVLILYRIGSATPIRLISALETIVANTDLAVASLANPPISHWVAAGICLGLATATIAQPILAPATAAALVFSNLPTLSRGIVELCTWRWKVSSLYTVIMGTTLITGQFLVAALMQTTITCWHAWTNHRLRRLVQDLTSLPDLTDVIEQAIATKATDLTSVRFAPGSTIHVTSGCMLPFDGIVVSGEGDLDEHGVRGTRHPTHRSVGDEVFAGSVVLKGALCVNIVAADAKTRLSAIRSTLHALICETVGSGGATPRAKQMASQFVPYTFGAGVAALFVGDISTLAAVLRPDFCTGASLTDRLGTLSSASHLLHEGWLVTNSAALDAMSRVNTIVLTDTSGTVGAPPELRVSMLSVTPNPVELHELKGTLADCVNHIRELCLCEQRTAVVGDHIILSQLTNLDVVRISLTPERCLGQRYVDLIALHSEPQQLLDLLRILRETRQPGRQAWAVVVGCNALAISGAFLVGLTSLHVVVLTNAGVLAAGLLCERHVRRSKDLLLNHSIAKRPSLRPEDVLEPVGIAPARYADIPSGYGRNSLHRPSESESWRLKATANQPRSPTSRLKEVTTVDDQALLREPS